MRSDLAVDDGGRRRWLARQASLQLGLLTFGAAIALTVRAHLGLTPWDVLHQGIALHTPLTIGEASEAVGVLVMAVSLLFGIRPGVATLCNIVLVGFWLDRILQLGVIPDAADAPMVVRLAMLALSLVLFGMASGAYIAPGLGAGPRDSFMLAMTMRTGRPVALTRGLVEATACGIGWLLGGPVGVGTIATALLIGPATQVGFALFGVDAHRPPNRRGGEVASPRCLEEPLAASA